MTPPPGPGSALAATQQGTSFSLQVNSPDDLQRLARMFAASGLFGKGGNPDAHLAECAVRILAGMEAGFGPFASATGVTLINGKPGFSSNLLAQAIKRHPSYDYRVLEKTGEVCRIRFLDGKEELGVEEFTLEMAKRAGLTKQGPWTQYPEAMLFARCLSAGMRTHCPDALGGAPAYTTEELGGEAVVPVTVTDAAPVSTDELAQQAEETCLRQGLTLDGIRVLCHEISAGCVCLADLEPHQLNKLARLGVTDATRDRCNAIAKQLTD